MIDLDGWRARANGGESQYALAVGLLAIAEAINAHATKELEAVARLMEHESIMAVRYILRPEHGKPTLAPLEIEDYPKGASYGRFVNMLHPELR